MSTFSLIPEHQ